MTDTVTTGIVYITILALLLCVQFGLIGVHWKHSKKIANGDSTSAKKERLINRCVHGIFWCVSLNLGALLILWIISSFGHVVSKFEGFVCDACLSVSYVCTVSIYFGIFCFWLLRLQWTFIGTNLELSKQKVDMLFKSMGVLYFILLIGLFSLIIPTIEKENVSNKYNKHAFECFANIGTGGYIVAGLQLLCILVFNIMFCVTYVEKHKQV